MVEGTGSWDQLGGSLLRSSRGKEVTSVETDRGGNSENRRREVNLVETVRKCRKDFSSTLNTMRRTEDVCM